jgi:phosphoglycerate dehydrogenase-like enzyme
MRYMETRPNGSYESTAPTEAQTRGRVLVTAPGFDVDGDQTGALLTRSGFSVDHANARGSRRPEDVAALTNDVVAAIVSSDPFTRSVFAASPKLRVIARLGVGVDSIDLDAATRAGVVVTTTPGLNDETCADHALALLLAVLRRVVENDASVRRGEWDRGGSLTPWDLHGKRVGVVGYGRIGSRVVRRLRGFGTEIKVFDPNASVETDLTCGVLTDLLKWADIVTLHAPLTTATVGLIGAPELAVMKPSAILINTSRGNLIDGPALLETLQAGRLRGAALDVFPQEPPAGPLWTRLPNLVLSPHIGGLSIDAIQAMSERCVRQVLDLMQGKVPYGVVNPDALKGAQQNPTSP